MKRAIADLAWCAGLFEGEGTVVYGLSRRGPLRIKISSTDEDVMHMMAARSGVGHVTGPHKPNGFGIKPYWLWYANGHDAVELLRAIRPYMGLRRGETIDTKIAYWEDRPVRKIIATPAVKNRMRRDRAAGMTYVDIAKKYGVSHAYIYLITRDDQRSPRRWGVAPAE